MSSVVFDDKAGFASKQGVIRLPDLEAISMYIRDLSIRSWLLNNGCGHIDGGRLMGLEPFFEYKTVWVY